MPRLEQMKNQEQVISGHGKSAKSNPKSRTESFSSEDNRTFWLTLSLITCIKLLLIPTYHSTDFEVHRNWLAITHSLPIKEWYTNAKSQWTLDYPPLFAWFEYLLSQLAGFFDKEMLKVDNLEYASPMTKIYQRTTVILADLMFAYGVREIGKVFYGSKQSFMVLTFLTLCNVGLLIVDHIHFQYNGFLLGFLLLSIARISQTFPQSRVLEGAFWFAVLLNLKHIYIYVAPAFGIWLLRCYCLKDGHFFKKIFKLGSIVLITLAVSFGPFVSQLPQVISRLFPFKRGLVHAYWAANAWALYTGADKGLSIAWKRLGWLNSTRTASMTGGLVQEDVYSVLPTPTPLATFIITFVSMLPSLWILFIRNTFVYPRPFMRCVILCGLSSFMFGWHVHEKAILTAIIPLCAVATTDAVEARVFIILSTAGQTALLPLLYPANLAPLKILLLITYSILCILCLTRLHNKPLLNKIEWSYVAVLPLLPLYENIVHKLLFSDGLPFLPLALTSMYCAVGITYSWLLYYYAFLYDCIDSIDKIQPKMRKSKEFREFEKPRGKLRNYNPASGT